MTRKFNGYGEPTPFSDWLRHQAELDSKLGYIATNLDYIWSNFKTKEWMAVEEKRYGADASWSQKQLFKMLHKVCKLDKNYRGIHLIQFEKESPDDGWIKIDRKLVTKEELIDFLRFKFKTS